MNIGDLVRVKGEVLISPPVTTCGIVVGKAKRRYVPAVQVLFTGDETIMEFDISELEKVC